MSTALAETIDHDSRLTYPISPDYVKGWTAEMAIREFVANAWDDDPSFSYEWRDGVLTIEDAGPGIPEYGLVLGVSKKSTKQVGQFGEGLKISSLVLARNKSIGRVRIETVGYGFEPQITKGSVVKLASFNGNGDKTELLAYDFFESARTRGTKVTIECSEDLAAKVKRAFRFFEPGYETPRSPGEPVLQNSGFIYIGGVLIQEKKDFVLGYDIALEDGKQLQNRDRTIIDGYELKRRVSAIVQQISDPDVLEKLVRAALEGKLPEAERAFNTYGVEPGYRKAMKTVAKRLFQGKKVCYRNSGYYADAREDEAVLDLKDRGYEVLEAKIDSHEHRALMTLLGVKSAGDLFKKPSLRKRDKQKTAWVEIAALPHFERTNLERAVAAIKSLHGDDAVGDYGVYSSTRLEDADQDLHWGGFYDPRSGKIGIHAENLTDFEATLEVMTHEVAHRLRHRSRRWDYGDRSRGFEDQLVQMASAATAKLLEAGLLPDTLDAYEVDKASAPKHPSLIAAELVRARVEATGLTTYAKLSDETGVTPHVAKTIVKGEDRGHRASPKPTNVRAVCERLGLDWPVIWLMISGINSFESYSRRKNGYLYGRAYVEAVEVADVLRARGDSMLADVVEAHAENDVNAFPDEEWLAPYRAAIEAEVARVASS